MDLRGHRVVQAFLLAAFSDGRAVRISERDPDNDAAMPLVGKDAQDACIFGEEQGAVGEDADIVLGGCEEARPHIAGNRRTARVDRS